jgi:hypothetical protein
VWRKLALPQIKPGLMALGIFSSFPAGANTSRRKCWRA